MAIKLAIQHRQFLELLAAGSNKRQDGGAHTASVVLGIPPDGEIPLAASRVPPVRYARWDLLPKFSSTIFRTIFPAQTLHFKVRGLNLKVAANHNRQAHQNAFHPFRSQLNRGNGCNLTGGKPMAVAKPENSALSLLILTGRHMFQDFFDLIELETLRNLIKAVGAACSSVESGWSMITSVPSAPLHGQRAT